MEGYGIFYAKARILDPDGKVVWDVVDISKSFCLAAQNFEHATRLVTELNECVDIKVAKPEKKQE